MNSQPCPREHDVVLALKSDRWAGELRSHAESCPLCHETVAVATALQQVAEETVLPVSYRTLWLRAQFSRKHERLSQLDRIALVGVFAVALIGIAGVVFWKWPLVHAWFTNASSEPVSNLPLYIAAGCAALVWFLTEEVLREES